MKVTEKTTMPDGDGSQRRISMTSNRIQPLVGLMLLVAAATTPGPAQAAPPRESVAIVHQRVDCVMAAQHPIIEACFAPASSVGRAQVQFRALETGPWYYVDMKPEGTCHRALLPKPRKDTREFQYFIHLIDRGFNATDSPAAAPGESHRPRVVSHKAECSQEMMMAPLGAGTAQPIVVGIARDSAGKLLDASAAAKLEQGASLDGFSSEGVKLASTGARPGESGAQVAAAGAAGGGVSTLLLIGGGAAAAAGVGVAVAAGGGTGKPEPASSASSAGGSLTGRWAGSAANGAGLTVRAAGSGIACIVSYDANADLSQSGPSLTGPLSLVLGTINCQPSEGVALTQPFLGTVHSGSFNATVTAGGGISLPFGPLVFTGSYTSNSMDLTASFPDPSFTVTYTLQLLRQ
jgi:hypothetical protein